MYLDIIIAIILILTIIEGIKDGFLLQFFSIFGIFIDFVVAQKFTPIVMEKLSIVSNENNYLLTYIGVFVVSYFLIAILMFLIAIVLKNQNKGTLSRGLGGVFGLVKGFIVITLILFVFNFAAQRYTFLKEYSESSKINTVFLEKSHYIEDYLPEELKTELNYIKGKEFVEKYFNKIF